MKNNFIIKFLKAIVDSGKDIHEVWQWKSISYKGWKVKGRDKESYCGFKNLQRRGIIKDTQGGKFNFTPKGRVWFSEKLIKHYAEAGSRWDKKWRIFMFDIPQELHLERNKLRSRLKTLGFYMMQKSVFVFPYPCEKELAEYCSKLKISDYVNFLEADSLGYLDGEIRKSFKL